MKLYITSILLLLSSMVFSQVDDADFQNKLGEVYSQGRIDRIMVDPQLNKHFKALIYDSYALEEVAPQKLTNTELPVLKSLTKRTKEDREGIVLNPSQIISSIQDGSFNIISMDIKRDLNENESYVLEGTNYILTIFSHSKISK